MQLHMKSKILGLLAVGLLVGPISANATWLGTDFNVTFYYPDMATVYCSNGDVTVGAGVEYPSSCSGFAPVSIDIGDDGFSVDTGGVPWGDEIFNGFLLTPLNGPLISSAAYLGGTMGVTSLLVQGGALWVNFAGQSGGVARFGLTPAVPEPGTLALLGLGLFGLGLSRRRKA